MIILRSSYDHLMIISQSSYDHLMIILHSSYKHPTIILFYLFIIYNHLIINLQTADLVGQLCPPVSVLLYIYGTNFSVNHGININVLTSKPLHLVRCLRILRMPAVAVQW
jgi:hypothetical protein